ncbi:glutamine synthetase family protein [Atopobium sp. oral taxon 416]|uniref:glutamine synthetase family protein n=1 Tax=Atopobium sp. oral taxon 416 TaxID=712157 RepID=UPI001BAE1A88|nr:glutamine synthetase family protein [Atopobium sp. oral taxon 416]QUC02741.1 glutamine synthetase [Atopobium sp. oral taxon 416]
MPSQKDIDFVLRTVEERNIRFVRLWFCDVSGNLKSFAISPEDLEEAFGEGVGFDGSAVDGFAALEESDMLAFPEPDTFQVLPWRQSENGAARMFCSVRTPDRKSFEGDPREVLNRVVNSLDAKGYVPFAAPRIEYFYFKDSQDPVLSDQASYFDLTPWDSAHDLRRDTTLMLERMSIPVEYSFHAQAPSQNGIELRYSEALSCADNIMTARLVIKQEAFANGFFASFMPKPFSDTEGSAMFFYESLMDKGGNNLFWGPSSKYPDHLSELANHFIAGILHYAPECTLITNPTVNSYKRLHPNSEVPCYTTWGHRNRSALVRVPMHKPGKHQSTRVELRGPDPTCNPYLVLALTFAAGVKGIEGEMKLQSEATTEDIYASEAELAKKGVRRLPHDLREAIEFFEQSEFCHEVLGDHICDYLVSSKRKEWDDYNTTVTDWERKHYYAGF